MDERTTLRYIDELQGQIDQLKKIIKGGGGPGTVVINPEGSATADLVKIKSGDTIYGLNYNKNSNRPQINGNLLTGDKNSKQLNIAEDMTIAAYNNLDYKYQNEIYFLTENAPQFTEQDTVAASGIEWSQSGDVYTASMHYTPNNTAFTGVLGVTCDNENITIVSFEKSSNKVNVSLQCDDPVDISVSVTFSYALTQRPGVTKVQKAGVEYGSRKDYRTYERVVGSWIDGKPLYQKTIETTTLSTDGTKTITLSNEGISNVDKVVSIDAMAVAGGGMAFNYYNGSSDIMNIYMTDMAHLSIYNVGEYRHDASVYITLLYTKTTD